MWQQENILTISHEMEHWCNENGVHPLLRPLIPKFGITNTDEANYFLRGGLSETTSSLAFGPNIYTAVKRINSAVNRGEHIVLFGDYDVDGTTGTAVLMTVLDYFRKSKGFTLDFMIPNRFTEGYGLNDNSMKRLLGMKPDLVITIDCGITSAKQIEDLKKLGIDTIVTDHHNPKGPLPSAAVAIVHPQVCNYPDHKICGCAVAYQLAKAIWETRGLDVPRWVEYDLTDLVALGTICDMMPLQNDNRIYVKEGLKVLNRGTRTSIAVMKSKFRWSKIDRNTVGFQIGPNINANGRMDNADIAVKFFLTKDTKEASRIVDIMMERNERRKEQQQFVVDEGLQQIPNQPYKNIIVISSDDFHEGVVGIAASKIMNKYKKPTFILHGSGEHVGGSARSIAGINLFESLKKFEKYLHSWGGHAAAAGLKLKKSEMQTFFSMLDEDLNSYGKDVWATNPKYFGEINSQDQLNDEFFSSLEMFEPFGYSFPEPIWKINGQIEEEKNLKKDSKVGKILIFGTLYNFAMWENAERAFVNQIQTYYGTWSHNPSYGKQFTAEDADPPQRSKIKLQF